MDELTAYCEVGFFLHPVLGGDSLLCYGRKYLKLWGNLCLHYNYVVAHKMMN